MRDSDVSEGILNVQRVNYRVTWQKNQGVSQYEEWVWVVLRVGTGIYVKFISYGFIILWDHDHYESNF